MSKTVPSIAAAFATIGLVLASLFVTAVPAQAATASVTLSPATTTVESNTTVTYTLSIVCNGPGNCDGSTVTFPTTSITGNGANNDIGSWFGNSSCAEVTRTVGSGLVTYTYGTIPTGNKICTFPVRAPEYITLGGAVATLTPTISGPGLTAPVTGASATLTSIAGHNASLAMSAPVNVLVGTPSSFTARFICGTAAEYTGDIGMSAIHIEVPLPANFQYSGFSTSNSRPASVTVTQPPVGGLGGTLIYDDATGATCGNPPLNSTNAMGITIQGTIQGPVGTQACATASATFTYIDNTPGSATSQTPCTTLIDIVTIVAKGATTTSLSNVGQHTFTGGAAYPYTFPGNWDGSGAPVTFNLSARVNPAANNAGVSYLMRDPLPCLDNLTGGVYLPNAVGVLCQNPAFVPSRITVTSGFTPTAADQIVLHYTDGSVENVPFAAGGWTVPAVVHGNGVAEIEIPAFAAEGSNTGTVLFAVNGWASSAAVPGNVLRNTMYSEPYLSGQPDPLRTPQASTANVGIVDPEDGAGEGGATVLYPSLTNTYNGAGTCVASVNLTSNTTASQRNFIEVTKAPSEAIYLDYLAPVGASITNGTTKTFTLTFVPDASRIFTATGVAAVVTTDFDGTGRTLYSWTIPAGVITEPGVYRIATAAFTVNLIPGCAGFYNSDMTLGYGAEVSSCVFNPNSSPFAQNPPMLPNLNQDLDTNGSPIVDNFCGYSARLNIPAINPAYSVNKTVQGNLDPSPAAPGTNGRVSPEGGEATYTVSFTNTGQSNLDSPVLYDILPRVGDTIASGSSPRDSDFAVTLTGLGALPAGVSVEYSTALNPCRPEVLPTNPGCADDWSATAPAALGDTTALRFVYGGTVFVTAAPGIHGFQVQYTVSTPVADNGDVAWNTVGSNATAGTALMGAAESTLVGLEAAQSPLLVTKTASVSSYDAVGTTIDYTFTVSNGSGVTLSGVSVTDEFTDAAGGSTAPQPTCLTLSNPVAICSGTSVTLLNGQVATFVASYTTTQSDLDHGTIVDIATVSGTPPTGGPLEGASNSVVVDADLAPSLELVKEASPTVVDSLGDSVGYSFTVTNTGNVTLTDVGITEIDFSGTGTPLSITCPTGPVGPGDDVECTAAYSVTQEDIDAGSITNTATAFATSPDGVVAAEPSSATVDVDQLPSLDFTKSATPEQVSAVGQTITYSFEVTNNGNVTISGVAIQEDSFSGAGVLSAIDCPTTVLAPEEVVTCSATYEVQQEDLDAGSISNSATATGNYGAGTPIPAPPTSDFTVDALSLPGITLDKSAELSGSAVGATVTYTFEVTNSGNVALHGVGVDDPLNGLSGITFNWAGDPGDLAAGASVTGTATYTVTQADLNAGTLVNEATATGTPATGDEVSDTDDATVTFVQDPQLELTKTGQLTDPDGIDIGSEVTFSFEIINTGNVTVENVDIEDDLDGLSAITFDGWPGDTGVLLPGESVTASATYELTEDDLEAGSLVNIATANGDAPGGDPSHEASVTVPLEVSPSITIDKVGTLDVVGAPVEGDTITFDFTIVNTGNVPLTGVAITDELDGLGDIDYTWPGATDGRIGIGESATATASYSLTQEDIDAGSVVNTAVVDGNAPGNSAATATDVEQVDLPADPELTFSKSSDFTSDAPSSGDVVTFDFTIENTGNVTVSGIDIADDLAGLSDVTFGAWPETEGKLAPGDSITASATYELTQADIDAGSLRNDAVASGDAARGGAVSVDADVTIPLTQVPSLALSKTVDRESAALGDVIEFTIVATNSGNTTLIDVVIEDELPGLSELDFDWPGTPGVIAPGEAVTATATYTVVASDVRSEQIVNVAMASASSLGESTVTATAEASVKIDRPDVPLALTGMTGIVAIGSIALALLGGGLVVLLGARMRRRRA